MTFLSYHSSSLSLIALETMRLLVLTVTKSLVFCRFGHIYWRNPKWKTSILCSVKKQQAKIRLKNKINLFHCLFCYFERGLYLFLEIFFQIFVKSLFSQNFLTENHQLLVPSWSQTDVVWHLSERKTKSQPFLTNRHQSL